MPSSRALKTGMVPGLRSVGLVRRIVEVPGKRMICAYSKRRESTGGGVSAVWV